MQRLVDWPADKLVALDGHQGFDTNTWSLKNPSCPPADGQEHVTAKDSSSNGKTPSFLLISVITLRWSNQHTRSGIATRFRKISERSRPTMHLALMSGNKSSGSGCSLSPFRHRMARSESASRRKERMWMRFVHERGEDRIEAYIFPDQLFSLIGSDHPPLLSI
jgi:hypothetical protein